MSDSSTPNYFDVRTIFINEIIFENKLDETDVTIFGSHNNPFDDERENTDYWCEFSLLTELLSFAGSKGETISEMMSDILNDKSEESPVGVDVENVFGEPLRIDNIFLQLYKPKKKDENDEWIEEEGIYIIHSVKSLEAVESEKKFSNALANLELSEYLRLLSDLFGSYIQLVNIGFKKKEARKRVGLEDKLLFKIAELQYQIIRNL